MAQMLEEIRPISLAEVTEASKRIASTIIRTPLVRLDAGSDHPAIYLKLENLQPTNSYKLRGGANAVAMLSPSDRDRGVWTISAGNAGQGIAYAARQAGVPCSVVVIETAPKSKIARMQALGARLILVPYATAWKALGDRYHPDVDGTFIHPFDDHNFIAGHATMALEIIEELPGVKTVIAGIGGGGLVTGLGNVFKQMSRATRIYGAEPATASPAALSFAKGSAQEFPDWKSSFVDGAGGQSLFPRMWERMKSVVDDCMTVSLDETVEAMKLLAEKARVIAEGAGALSVAAALKLGPNDGPIVAIVSGGNVDLETFCGLVWRSST